MQGGAEKYVTRSQFWNDKHSKIALNVREKHFSIMYQQYMGA